MTVDSPEFRDLFTRKNVLASAWYRERLERQQLHDNTHWRARIAYLQDYASMPYNRKVAKELGIAKRIVFAEKKLAESLKPGYLDTLKGTIGLDKIA